MAGAMPNAPDSVAEAGSNRTPAAAAATPTTGRMIANGEHASPANGNVSGSHELKQLPYNGDDRRSSDNHSSAKGTNGHLARGTATLDITPQAGVVLTNWAATCTARPRAFYTPRSVEEVQAIVRDCARRGATMRAVGTVHSPNDCAMCDDVVISLANMDRVLVVDAERSIAKVQAGVTLSTLNEVLVAHGLALPNLGSISWQTLAGAIGTGVHGTGATYGIFATAIVELQIVLASGEVVVASRRRNADLFLAALCNLGSLGVVTGAVIKCVPAFDLHAVETPSTLTSTLRELKSRVLSAPYYRFWWFPHTDSVIEWRAQPVRPRSVQRASDPPSTWAGAVVQPLRDAWTWLITMGIGFYMLQAALWVALFLPVLIPLINKLWYKVIYTPVKSKTDRSDRVFNFNCLFKQHVDEWAIPVELLPQALAALKSLLDTGGYKVHFPVEVRFVAGDDIWLSPAYGRPTAFIGIIMYKPFGWEVDYKEYFRKYEEIMAAYGGRPHWAKDFHYRGDNDFARVYPRWNDWKRLREKVDPDGVFLNPWARRTLGLPDAPTPTARNGASSGSPSGAAAVPEPSAAATLAAKRDPAAIAVGPGPVPAPTQQLLHQRLHTGVGHARSHTFDDADEASENRSPVVATTVAAFS